MAVASGLRLIGIRQKIPTKNQKPPPVKVAKTATRARTRSLPAVKFEEDQKVTSFGGLVIFQRLFEQIGLRAAPTSTSSTHETLRSTP
ncbi:MAG: hypothetical protein ACI9MB_005352 [Verrucomicrobiales bacterium]